MNAKLIKIDISKTGGGDNYLWHATSPDLPGFRVTELSRAEVLAAISGALEFLCTGWTAHQVEWKKTDDLYWVIVPQKKSERAA